MPAAIRIDLCSTAEVAPGNALKVDKAGLVLAGFNLDGEFFVTDRYRSFRRSRQSSRARHP
jgi:hypothetical protein